mgnify:CR=1 FL=1
MNSIEQLKQSLEDEGYRLINDDISAATGDLMMVFEEEDTGRRYRITVEEI